MAECGETGDDNSDVDFEDCPEGDGYVAVYVMSQKNIRELATARGKGSCQTASLRTGEVWRDIFDADRFADCTDACSKTEEHDDAQIALEFSVHLQIPTNADRERGKEDIDSCGYS